MKKPKTEKLRTSLDTHSHSNDPKLSDTRPENASGPLPTQPACSLERMVELSRWRGVGFGVAHGAVGVVYSGR